MKHGFVKVAAASPALRVADPDFNAQKIIEVINEQAKAGAEILVFPELCLSGYTCGDLFLQKALTDGCLAALQKIAEATEGKTMLVFVGLPVVVHGKLYNCAAGIANGKVCGLAPKINLPNYGEFYEARYFARGFTEDAPVRLPNGDVATVSANTLFYDKQNDVCVACEICEDLWAAESPSVKHVRTGADIIVNLSASDETVGKREYRKTLVSAQSGKCVCGYVYADAGMYESTTDCVFAGNHLIYENGALLAEAAPFSGEVAVAEIDVGYLKNERKRLNTAENLFSRDVQTRESYVWLRAEFIGDGDLSLRNMPVLPFVPAGEQRERRAEEILTIQSHALARRLAHTKSKTAVLGVSGGLDSTLALLVAARAFDILKKPRTDIVAVTMPGFGTSDETKNNSFELMRCAGVTVKTVPIAETVKKHFEDIGHDARDRDTTYENAQARYRTMVLMDIANQTGGLVIGTGDLSEAALGWCTYNGDHMSMYGVNASIPKTLVKYLVSYEGKRIGGKTETVLNEILNTEISPELLPPDENGAIAQKTEDIVGPYELHDFYLYRFLRCGDEPEKIFYLAQYAFAGKYDRATLKKWLKVFYGRFFSQQFKRNCVPDGVKVGAVSLSPRADWRMPSDVSAALLSERVEKL